MYYARPASYSRLRPPLQPRRYGRGAIAPAPQFYLTTRRGFGDVTKASLARTSGSLAGTTIMALAPLAGPAAPFVVIAGLAVAGLSNLFASVFSGCGPTCTQATQVVDQVEAQFLKPNVAQYLALPVRTRAAQQAALQVFDYGWSMVLQGCGDPALGDAGRRCISERAVTGNLPGHPGMNWFTLYRDPIANDPGVVDNPPGSAVLQAFGLNPQSTVAGVPISDLLLPAGLIALGLML